MPFPVVNYPAVPHTWVLVYRVSQRSHFTKDYRGKKKNLTQFIGREFNHNFISNAIGSFISGIKTRAPFQITTLNVMGASSDLIDVSMHGNLSREIYLMKCRSHGLNAVSRGKRVIYRGYSALCNHTEYIESDLLL